MATKRTPPRSGSQGDTFSIFKQRSCLPPPAKRGLFENQQQDEDGDLDVKAMFKVIMDGITTLTSDLTAVKQTVFEHSQDLEQLKTTAAEAKIERTRIHDKHQDLTQKVSELELKLGYLKAEAELKNLILHGVPEANAGQSEDLNAIVLNEVLGKLQIPEIRIESAVRLGKQPSAPPARPRPIKVKLGNLEARNAVFKKKHLLAGTNISISPVLPKIVRDHEAEKRATRKRTMETQ